MLQVFQHIHHKNYIKLEILTTNFNYKKSPVEM